ncbi:MAG: ester cyclase [Calothrix sp. FI2-JRJ7]|jgi:predicted ester cyclase|nr:ester cyclase [Calothrix sp. FI2-JRJ7]
MVFSVHTGLFFGMAPTGKIAEHWSVSDAASLMLQLQG